MPRLIGQHFLLTLANQSGPEVIKLFFMFNSPEHEIFSANKYENLVSNVQIDWVLYTCMLAKEIIIGAVMLILTARNLTQINKVYLFR